MKNLREQLTEKSEDIIASALTESRPIWELQTSRQMAKRLGVTIQALANWRVRDNGPRYHIARKGLGNRCFYRMSDVLEWINGRPSWQFDKDWLVLRGLAPRNADQDFVAWFPEKVAPHAGAWIETSSLSVGSGSGSVAPHAGAWIETRPRNVSLVSVWRRPPRGGVDRNATQRRRRR